MKPAAYIFTVLMLFFMAQPILVQCQSRIKAPPPETCCPKGGKPTAKPNNSDRKACERPTSKDCDRNTACNPFASCSQCHYVAASKFLYGSGILEPASKISIPPSKNIEPGFLSDCWHPPEVVAA